MNKLHLQGMPNLKPDAFTYTAVIDVSTLVMFQVQAHLCRMTRSSIILTLLRHHKLYVILWIFFESRHGQRGEYLLLDYAYWRRHYMQIFCTYPAFYSNLSGYRGAAARADQLLDTMESKYLAGDMGLKPNTFTYNAVSSFSKDKSSISHYWVANIFSNILSFTM